ncbi:MAG TPA: VanZ family protein [Solirubrobacteraceae bacterium]
MARPDARARLFTRFAPPIVLMGVIYALSAQPDLNSGLGTVDLVGRKIVHMGEYGLLWFLWHRALGHRHPGGAAAIAIGYAMTDEFHQTFVHGREGTPRDVLIDAAGVAIAYAIWRRRATRPAAGRA